METYEIERFYADEKKQEKPILGEVVAARGEDIWTGFMGEVYEDKNEFFNHSSKGKVEQCQFMEDTNPYLFGLIQTRKLALLGLGREIVGEGPEADFVREVFAGIPNFHSFFYQALDCIPVGFSITEIPWQEMESKFLFTDLLVRYQDKFKFDNDNKTRLLTQDEPQDGIKTHPKKFAVMTFNERYGNRYGTGIFQKVYWYWFWAQNAMKWWAQFIERHGVPIPIVTVEGKLTTASKNSIDDWLKNMRAGTGLRFPKGVVVDVLQKAAQQQGSIASFSTFMDMLNKGMAVAILGQDLTSQSQKTGSYAQAKIHEYVRQDILHADILMCENFFNDYPIKWLVDYNFSNVKEYPKWRLIKDRSINKKEMSEVIKSLKSDGLRITEKWVYETFGIPVPDEGEKVLESAQPPAIEPPKKPEFSDVALSVEAKLYQEEKKRLGLS